MLTTLLSAVVFFIIQLIAPHKAKPITNYDKLILVNRYKYNILEVFSLIPLFLFVSWICYFVYLLGNDIQHFFTKDRIVDFGIYPSNDFWLVIGLCFGCGLIIPPMNLLYRILLQDEYEAYLEYTNRKHGYDGFAILRPLCALCTAAGICFSFLGLNWYVEVKENSIILNDFFQLQPDQYQVQDIQSITHYNKILNSKNEEVERPHYAIVFSNGKTWHTHTSLNTAADTTYEAIVKHLLEKAEVPLIKQKIDNNW
ncbi:hypothetical protein ACMA1I_02385 [Pontibacter sp. 13R65]|uniref:hypothetical protein n=1 Tax=Pontibacter sp. 13R65 TaxID=3127458 RepID=UPI00301E1B1A